MRAKEEGVSSLFRFLASAPFFLLSACRCIYQLIGSICRTYFVAVTAGSV